MNLYQIDSAIENLFVTDMETGEVNFDEAELEQLLVEREKTIENLALFSKDLKADISAIKAEEDALSARRKHKEKVLERVKASIEYALNGQKFETSRCAISWRKSQSVSYDPTLLPPIYWKEVEPKADLIAVKAALKRGEAVAGAWLEEKNNIQVK